MSNTTVKSSSRMSWVILLILTLLYALNFMDRMVVSVSMEAIKADFGLSDTQIGMIQSIFFLGVGILTLPAGLLIDRWSRKKAVTAMAVIWSMATIATGLSKSFVSLLTSRFTVGAGEAGFAPGGCAWISELFPKEKRATANGIFNMGMIIGVIFGMGVGGAIITHTGNWRLAYYAFGIPGVLLGLLILLMPESVRPKTKSQSISQIIKEMGSLFQIKTFAAVTVGSGLYMILSSTIQTWAIVLLMRAYNLDEVKAGMLMGILVIPTLLAPLMGGAIADRLQKLIPHGRPLYCAVGCLGTALVYATQFYTAGIVALPIFVAIMILCGLVGTSVIPVYLTVAQDVVPEDKRGTAASIVMFVQYAMFTWWGSTLVGKVSDMLGSGMFGLRMGLLTLCPFTLIAAIIFLKAGKTYQEDSARADETVASRIETV